jgi:hypothetical protein
MASLGACPDFLRVRNGWDMIGRKQQRHIYTVGAERKASALVRNAQYGERKARGVCTPHSAHGKTASGYAAVPYSGESVGIMRIVEASNFSLAGSSSLLHTVRSTVRNHDHVDRHPRGIIAEDV